MILPKYSLKMKEIFWEDESNDQGNPVSVPYFLGVFFMFVWALEHEITSENIPNRSKSNT